MMMRKLKKTLLTIAACLVGSTLGSAPVYAQFQPRPISDPATGERYHIEAAAGFWFPTADLSLSSQSLGLAGSTIDFKKDLGLTDQRLSELQVVGRPARKHKLRFAYIPIEYSQQNTIQRDIKFNGQLYAKGLPVNSDLSWKAYRFAYEYDFITRNRGFGGFILEAKYTDVTATLQSPLANQFIHAKAPVPAIGGIARVYVVPNISITGEVTGVKIPDSISKEYKAHYADVDIYGTLNFTNYIGIQGGFRSIDVGYHVNSDTGSFVLKGIYFGVVARY